MKIFDNGTIREMTPEELNKDKDVDAFLAKIPVEGKSIIEEFIDRLSNANTFLDIIKIAKEIKSRKG
jgi:hypothetical protein